MPPEVVPARQKQVSENGSMQLHLSQVCCGPFFLREPRDCGCFFWSGIWCLNKKNPYEGARLIVEEKMLTAVTGINGFEKPYHISMGRFLELFCFFFVSRILVKKQ